jgi:hypothetical protein
MPTPVNSTAAIAAFLVHFDAIMILLMVRCDHAPLVLACYADWPGLRDSIIAAALPVAAFPRNVAAMQMADGER